MKQLYSDLKKILFGGLVVLAALGWFNAAHAARGLDRIMTRETVVARGTIAAPDQPDIIEELINTAPRTYHSTVRVLPHPVQGTTAPEAQAAYEARLKARPCELEELRCLIRKGFGS